MKTKLLTLILAAGPFATAMAQDAANDQLPADQQISRIQKKNLLKSTTTETLIQQKKSRVLEKTNQRSSDRKQAKKDYYRKLGKAGISAMARRSEDVVAKKAAANAKAVDVKKEEYARKFYASDKGKEALKAMKTPRAIAKERPTVSNPLLPF